MIHLDTSFLIRALVRGSPADRQLRAWLAEDTVVAVSVAAWAEFLCGPVEASHVELATRIIGDPVPMTPADASATARLFNLGGRRRGSFVDCMIAAIALRMSALLATGNPADFRRLEPGGLRILAS